MKPLQKREQPARTNSTKSVVHLGESPLLNLRLDITLYYSIYQQIFISCNRTMYSMWFLTSKIYILTTELQVLSYRCTVSELIPPSMVNSAQQRYHQC